MMKAVIVDDELSIHNSIRNILNLKYSDIDLAASAESVKEGVESIIRYKPDLVFLDIEMPDGTGFDLIDRLTPTDFKPYLSQHTRNMLWMQ
jgi:two-component system LytT family response regulator